MTARDKDAMRGLPAVDRVIDALEDEGPHRLVADAARAAVDAAREAIAGGAATPSMAGIVDDARRRLADRRRSMLAPVINATGVLIHTNLGRVPLGPRQLDAVVRIASGYSNLEYDVAAGRRGSRYEHAAALLRALTGAEAALVVNNNAAAVLVTLAALCAGREVIISRGELIEIGGEFRIPDVMAASGARLVEVGTTNRTHIGDYERAIGPDTSAILKVHPSNYRVVGFTAAVAPRDVARLAAGRRVTFLHDLGSGYVGAPEEAGWVRDEPPVSLALADGADVVTFSGDKLLGGPQAGVIVGRAEAIESIARHPLMRAVRVDKMTLAALEATLLAYLEDRPAEVPLWDMASLPTDVLERRARALSERLAATEALKAEAVPTSSVAGGGSLPGAEVPSWAVALVHAEKGPDELDAALRLSATPVVGRIEDDRLLLDLRTVPAEHDAELGTLIEAAAAPNSP